MDVRDVMRVLDADLICGEENLDTEVHDACGSDMMSDVLAFVKNQAVLLTGLVNIQVVRTADMMDMVCIVFVRGKEPDEDMIALAKRRRDGADENQSSDVYCLRAPLGKRSQRRGYRLVR